MRLNFDAALFATITSIVGVAAVLHVLGSYAPLRSQLWGVHFYGFYHLSLLVVATILLLGFTLWIAMKQRSPVGSSAEEAGPRDLSLPQFRLAGTVLAAAAVVAFWVARTRNTYLGDGNVLVASLAEGKAFHPLQPLTMAAQQQIYRVTAPLLDGTARSAELVAWDAAALGSVIAGAGFVVVCWLLAAELAGLQAARGGISETQRSTTLLIWITLIAQGYIQLFFGYVENYAFYTVGVGLFLWLSLRFLRGAAPLLLPAGAVVVALAFHLSAAVLLPAAAALVVWAIASRERRLGALRDVVIAAVTLLGLHFALAALRPGYSLLSTILDVSGLALSRKAESIPGYLLSALHFRDFFNEQLLIGPLGLLLFLPAAIMALIAMSAGVGRRATATFLLVAGATYLVVSWLAGDSNLGYARNWDLLSPGGLVLTVAGMGLFLLLAEGNRWRAPALACAIVVSLYHTAPWIATNASAERSLERLKTLPLGRGRTEVLVAQWYRREGNVEERERWLRKALAVNPANNNAHYLLGKLYAERGDMSAAADAYAEAIKLRPDKILFRQHIIQALFGCGRGVEAIPHLEFYLERRPEDGNMWIFYGDALRRADREAEAMAAFERAVPFYEERWAQDPNGYRTNLGYGWLLFNMGAYERAIEFLERAVEAKPESDAALGYIGRSLRHLGRPEEAKAYFRRCLEINPQHPDRARIEVWLEE